MALSQCGVKVELQLPTTFTDFSTVVSAVLPEAQNRMLGAAYVFGVDYAAQTKGKLEPFNITLRGLYATGTTDPCTLVQTYHQASCGTNIGVRVSIPTGAVGDKVATYSDCPIVSYKIADVDASSGDPLFWEAVVSAASVTMSIAA